MRRIITLFFLTNLISLHFTSQEIIDGMVTYNYTTEDGLPNNQVLCSMQDSKGYMWFGTGGGGAARYDGANFEIFDISKGLHDNEVYQLFEDHLGRIWFGTANLQFSYLENNVIKSYEHNNLIKDQVPMGGKINGIYLDEEGVFYIFFHNISTIIISKDGQILSEISPERFVEIYLFEDGSTRSSRNMIPFSSEKIGTNYNHKEPLIFYNSNRVAQKTELIFNHRITKKFYSSIGRILTLKNDQNTLLFDRHKLKIYNSKLKQIASFDIYEKFGKFGLINVYLNNDKIWIHTFKGGIFIGRLENNEFKVEENIFKKDFITTMTKDESNGIWLTSHAKGVFYIPYPNHETRPRPDNRILFPKVIQSISDDAILTSIEHNKLTLVRTGLVDSVILESDVNRYFTDIIKSPFTDSIYVSSVGYLYVFHPMSTNIKSIGPTRSGVKLAINESNELMMAGMGFISKYKNGVLIESKSDPKNSVYSIEYKNNIPFVGTSNGIYQMKFHNDSVTYFMNEKDKSEPILNAHIMDIESFHNGFWLAAQGKGIAYYTDSLEFAISEKDGLSSTQIISLKQDGDTLWVSTHNGLNKLVFNSDLELIENNIFNKNNGLSSNTIVGVECTKNNLFISTKAGIDIIPRKDLYGKSENISLKITEINPQTNREMKIYNNASLNYDVHDLSIYYEAIQFNTSNKHHFRYRLLPQEQQWKTTDLRQIDYNNLAPENYTFHVEIKNNQGNWVARDEISFKIKPPFWKSIWFITLSTLLTLFTIFLIFKKREDSFREKVRIENEMNLLRGKALRAQVNPHFIFNTLNAIQNFVLEGDFENSNKFITYFSKLIRKILQQSTKDFVTLDEEIDLLNMYLLIEQMRYDNKFVFEMDIDKTIKTNRIKIPPMLIQPYVENSIWHGLADRSKDGMVKVSFENKGMNQLVCIVEDNGIGRKAAQNIKNEFSDNRKSVGMSLSNDRLKALNNTQINLVKIEDLYSDQGEANGTKVIITIPYNNYE